MDLVTVLKNIGVKLYRNIIKPRISVILSYSLDHWLDVRFKTGKLWAKYVLIHCLVHVLTIAMPEFALFKGKHKLTS